MKAFNILYVNGTGTCVSLSSLDREYISEQRKKYKRVSKIRTLNYAIQKVRGNSVAGIGNKESKTA